MGQGNVHAGGDTSVPGPGRGHLSPGRGYPCPGVPPTGTGVPLGKDLGSKNNIWVPPAGTGVTSLAETMVPPAPAGTEVSPPW